MYIATKDTKLIVLHETEWQCRRKAKGLDKSEYWTWLATITTQDEHGHDVLHIQVRTSQSLSVLMRMYRQDLDSLGIMLIVIMHQMKH